MEESPCWTSEKPDPRVFAGDEKREFLFSQAFAQWVHPMTIFLVWVLKYKVVAERKAVLRMAERDQQYRAKGGPACAAMFYWSPLKTVLFVFLSLTTVNSSSFSLCSCMSVVQDSKRGVKLTGVPAYCSLAVWRGKHPQQPLTAMRNEIPRKEDHEEKLRTLGLFTVAKRGHSVSIC